MEILTRKEALLSGSSKYFTGEPCKNDHLTYRYTQSGSCEGCIHGDVSKTIPADHTERREILHRKIALAEKRSEIAIRKLDQSEKRAEIAKERISLTAATRESIDARREQREQRKQSLNELTRAVITCPDGKIGVLRNYAHLLATTRNATIQFADVAFPQLTPTRVSSQIGRYTLSAYPEDLSALRDFANALVQAVSMASSTVIAERDRRNKALLDQVNNPSDWPKESA